MEIVSKDTFYVIGKKVSCEWDRLFIEMPKAWEEVRNRIGEIENRRSPYFLDICLQLVGNEFTQLVGVEVTDLEEIPEGFEGYKVPKQTYIYTKHLGPVENMVKTFEDMTRWAKEQNLTLDPLEFKIQSTHENNDEAGHDLYFKII